MRFVHTLTAALLAGLAAFTTAPAHAATSVHRDAVGDVRSYTGDDPPAPAPANRSADVRRLTIQHAASALRIRMRVREVDRRTGFALARVRTPRRDLDVVLDRDSGTTQLIRRDGNPVRCAGAAGGFQPRADRVWVTIPRSCLGSPRWVRVGAGLASLSGYRVFIDDARRDGRVGDELVLGPRLRRG